jgi:hypothetical protein
MYRAGLVALGLGAASSGCSLLLDFGPGAVPADAAIDAPYSQDECDYKEPNNSLAEAMPITAADTGPAAICAGEQSDFYKFTVPAGTASFSVRINLAHRVGGDLDLKIIDPTGAAIGSSRGFNSEEVVTCPGVSPACPAPGEGEYAFEVVAGQTGDVNRYDFALTITPM